VISNAVVSGESSSVFWRQFRHLSLGRSCGSEPHLLEPVALVHSGRGSLIRRYCQSRRLLRFDSKLPPGIRVKAIRCPIVTRDRIYTTRNPCEVTEEIVRGCRSRIRRNSLASPMAWGADRTFFCSRHRRLDPVHTDFRMMVRLLCRGMRDVLVCLNASSGAMNCGGLTLSTQYGSGS
jgi:hypothetical protein